MAEELGVELGMTSGNRAQIAEYRRPSDRQKRDSTHSRALLAAVVSLALLAAALATIVPQPPSAFAASDARAAANASCATLAGVDPTATNGSSWGRTILAGNGAKDGWFGVNVCSNGFNSAAPNGSNVSCDRVPSNWSQNGCAPGGATDDGYGWTFQCPELVVRFSAWAFSDKPGDWGRTGNGNAPDLWLAANHPSDFVMYRNGSAHAPVPGDILVWGYLDGNGNPWPAGPNGSHGGHIAVVAAVRNGMVITAEQNVKWGSQDHPSDKLALTQVGDRWILSGSTVHQTKLPTYRWLSTMGISRGTFGWLHNVKNTGQFPSGKTTTKKPTPTPTAPGSSNAQQPSQETPGGMPTLAPATAVTKDGQLTDLVWTTQSFFADSSPGGAQSGQPYAQARGLGAPPGGDLALGQTPASVVTSSGTRYTYAIGADGHLYAARTGPTLLGVFWSDLGMPAGASLTGSAVASLFGGGIAVVAQGTDGNLYWRAGPIGTPGAWSSVGAPSGVTLSDSLAVTGAPGAGTPLILALGTDGVIYERIWQDATIAADGTTELPAGWSAWMAVGGQPKDAHFSGQLLVVPEPPSANKWIGAWPDTPLNLFVLDGDGGVWWLRSLRLTSGWTATQIQGPVPFANLLAGVAVAASATNSASVNATSTGSIQLYATTADATYTVAAALPASDGKPSAQKQTWTTMAALPAKLSSDATGTAVSLAAASSIVIVGDGDALLVGGASDATSIAMPDGQAAADTPAKTKNPWLVAPTVNATQSFGDTLTGTSVDTRWQLQTPKARANARSDGLRLTPNAQGVAALTQMALPGDAQLSVKVSDFDTLASGAHAGLVLYLDDADWMTLTVDGGGSVALCTMAWQQAAPCISQAHVASEKVNTVWLRVLRADDGFTATASADGKVWRTIGQWTPTASAAQGAQNTTAQATPSPTASTTATITASPSPTATATAAGRAADPTVAPLAFTSWGILAQGDGTRRSWPAFTDFTVATANTAAG